MEESQKYMLEGNKEALEEIESFEYEELNKEVDVIEFSLDEEEIEELISKLIELKETKTQINLEVDEDNELIIHYERNISEEENNIEKNLGENL